MPRTVRELLASGRKSYSFEFFPPKTDEGERALWAALAELEALSPTFVSVTYGAGGSTRDRTVAITGKIATDTDLVPVGHLTCVGASRAELKAVIGEYRAAGVRNILALRGDPQGGPGSEWLSHPQGLDYSYELVELVREEGDFAVGVAAFPEPHPASMSAQVDAQVLLKKQQAGADFAVTQFFFRSESYFELIERSRTLGITIPIIPGIMPVTNLAQIQRFAVLSGANFPEELAAKFEGIEGEQVREVGVELASKLCQELLDGGAPGLHFYTLNRSTATREIYEQLGLSTTTS